MQEQPQTLQQVKATLYKITKEQILPFTEETLCQASKEEFLKKCKNFPHELLWGDAIQIDEEYRNQSKYFYSNNSFIDMFREHIGPYFDYGVLPSQFSVIDKKLPLDHFNETMYYNAEACPWNPELQKEQLIKNMDYDTNTKTFRTNFIWRNKKIKLHSRLCHPDKDILPNIKIENGGSFNIYDEEKKEYTDVFLRYSMLKVLVDDYVVPGFIKPYIYKTFKKDDSDKRILVAGFVSLSSHKEIVNTEYDTLNKDDYIMLNESGVSLNRMCINYIATLLANNKDNKNIVSISTKNDDYYDKLENVFIDNILKSKYLYFEEFDDSCSEYAVEYF
jgi:hypothetical protein